MDCATSMCHANEKPLILWGDVDQAVACGHSGAENVTGNCDAISLLHH